MAIIKACDKLIQSIKSKIIIKNKNNIQLKIFKKKKAKGEGKK